MTKNRKIEIIAEINTTNDPKQARIDGSRFGLGKQKLWLKRNFPKTAKTAISGPKRWNSAKKGHAPQPKVVILKALAKSHQQ